MFRPRTRISRASLLVTAVCIVGGMAAAPADSVPDIFLRMTENARIVHGVQPIALQNPASMSRHYKYTLNEIEARWNYAGSTRPPVLQAGSGYSKWEGSATAYIRKGKNDIWGSAGYENGTRRDVRFSETSDFGLLYPYVMADTIGGDRYEETYRFEGGFAHHAGAFSVGARGGYRALLAYRTVDPRPRNLVGDLDFAAGVVWHGRKGLRVGAAVEMGKYKQTNVLEFYNETGVPVVYHSTGLGMDYYRFRGTNTGTYYNGRTFGGIVHGSLDAGAGMAYASIRYSHFSFDKIISTLNELPMASAGEHTVEAEAGYYMALCGGRALSVRGMLAYKGRTGTENVFGDAQNNVYPQIAAFSMYRHMAYDACGEVAVEDVQAAVSWAVAANGGYFRSDEQYADPAGQLLGSYAHAGLKVQAGYQAGRFLLRGSLCGAAAFSLHSVGQLPQSGSLTLAAPSQVLMGVLSHSCYEAGAQVRVDYRLSARYAIYARAVWQRGFYGGGSHGDVLRTAVGFAF